jgi:predicted ATPase
MSWNIATYCQVRSLASASSHSIEARPSDACFRLLATTRVYGRERLRERGEMELIASRHAAYSALWRPTIV